MSLIYTEQRKNIPSQNKASGMADQFPMFGNGTGSEAAFEGSECKCFCMGGRSDSEAAGIYTLWFSNIYSLITLHFTVLTVKPFFSSPPTSFDSQQPCVSHLPTLACLRQLLPFWPPLPRRRPASFLPPTSGHHPSPSPSPSPDGPRSRTSPPSFTTASTSSTPPTMTTVPSTVP